MTDKDAKIRELEAELEGARLTVEIAENDIGRINYKGNSVAWWHAKATAHTAALNLAWEAMRAAGIQSGRDGKHIADAIRELAARVGASH